MEEEEARLKALLEQTEDFDERRKIRAELRAVRKKMLDTLSATAEAESNERAARRAERARARKAEEEASNHTGPAITDKILSEIDDEDTLQTLLNEIPTSQIEDRRSIRARIREVKRKKVEEEEPTARHTRRTRESEKPEEPTSTRDRRRYQKSASDESIETKPEEPSSVTSETTTNDSSYVTITTTSDNAPCNTIDATSEEEVSVSVQRKTEEKSDECSDELDDKLYDKPTNEVSEEPTNKLEIATDEPSNISIKMSTGDPEAVTIETTNANIADDEDEVKFKLMLQHSKDIQLEEDTEDTMEQSAELETDQAVEILNNEPIEIPGEIKIEQTSDENHIEDQNEEINENVCEEPKDELIEEETQVNGQGDEETVTVGEGISLEFKINGEVNLSADSEKSQDNQDSGVNEAMTEMTDGGGISKDKRSESNASTTSSEDKSRRVPHNDEKKKPGRINQVDFRNNLKKSGKIGAGVVSLEKKNSTTGAQVDFRSGSLKKSGRIGSGTVNLENKISTQGAQVDFRSSSLKPSGKIGTGVVNLERKTNAVGAQVDFRNALKKGGSSSVKTPGGIERKRNEKSETNKGSQESVEQPTKPEVSELTESSPELDTAVEDSSEKQAEPNVPVKVTIPAPVEKKAPIKPVKPVPTKSEKRVNQNQLETSRNETKTTQNEPKTAKKEEPAQNGPVDTDENKDKNREKDELPADDEKDELPSELEIKLGVKVDKVADSRGSSVNHKEKIPASKEKEVPQAKRKAEFKYKPRDSYKTREETAKGVGGKSKLFDKLSKFQAKDETVVKPKGHAPRSSQKKDPAPSDKAVNGLAVKVENTSIIAKEPESPVEIEITEHLEDDGETEVREVTTKKQDSDGIEEKKEVTTTTKTTTPSGGKITTQKKETKTRKTFTDPELQKRLAQRQRERAMAKREQASSAKNKRLAFMQKLEANSPAEKGPSNIKRSGSNVDKLLAWCRFKLREYEGIKLTNFSSSWADGLAFCALMHLYLPEKIPYEELLAGADKKRNFEVAFSAATEAGVPELLEVEDMLSVANPEPKSVMTYVSSIYKHFNPS